MATNVHTYTGFWTNWSHGPIQGATLTIPQQSAGLLAAFLALYVSFAGGMFWKIMAFALHQLNTTHPSNTQDFLHHQRQVVLRNSGGGSGGAALALFMLPFQLSNTSRKSSKAILRCVPFALLALATLLLFSIAGIFTSAITKSLGNTTLIRGPSCGGYLLNNSYSSSEPDPNFAIKQLGDTKDAATYVQQCYQNSTSHLPCETYVQPSIPFTTNQNASCPFASGICKMGDTAAFSMDTGLLDSHVDFGINAPPENRILFRRIATCAPITAKKFATIQNDANLGEILYVNLGPVPGLDQNYTFSYILRSQNDSFAYQLSPILATGYNNSAQWQPIPELKRVDADVSLFFLAENGMTYESPSTDPWITADLQISENPPLWTGNPATNVLGCIDQYQICNPNRPRTTGCSPLSSMAFIYDRKNLGLNLNQIATVGRFTITGIFRSMYSAVQGRGASALNAQDQAYETIQQSLPNNQWQKEVSLWFSNCLAKEQAWAVEWATAPRNIETNNGPIKLVPFPDAQSKQQCLTQMVRDLGSHVSFSVLGMTLILALGGLIIIVGLSIDSLVGKLRTQKSMFKKEEWDVEETLQLHRAAYTGLGHGSGVESGELPPSTVFLRATSVEEKVEVVAFTATNNGKNGTSEESL